MMTRSTKQIVLHRLLSLLNGGRLRPCTANSRSTFVELSLGFSDPLVLCMDLSRRLGIPKIPSNYRRQIASTFEIQDPPIPPMNRSARMDLTVDAFAEKIAQWLDSKGISVQENASS